MRPCRRRSSSLVTQPMWKRPQVDDVDDWARPPIQAEHDNFHVHYVVDKAPWWGLGWKGSVGRVNADIIKAHCPAPEADHLVMVCGPPGMMAAISGDKAKDKSQGEVSGILADLGYTADTVFKF